MCACVDGDAPIGPSALLKMNKSLTEHGRLLTNIFGSTVELACITIYILYGELVSKQLPT